MKIAVDGGAFQQGIAAGIFKVAVGLINEISRIAPHFSFVLVVDPRAGPLKPELLKALNTVPEIVEAPVGMAYGRPRSLTTKDPHVVFEIDGRLVSAIENDGAFRYQGPAPQRMMRIHTRLEQPSAGGSSDTRHLGLGIRRIQVTQDGVDRSVSFDDPRLAQGFHMPEPHIRWTSGPAVLPSELFDRDGGDVTVAIDAPGHLAYNFNIFATKNVSTLLQECEQKIELLCLERKLKRLECGAYIANHFIPIRLQSLRNYAILHDLIPLTHPNYFMADARRNFDDVFQVLLRADHVFSVSQTSRETLMTLGGVQPDRVSVIRNDVDPIFRETSGPAAEAVRASYGIVEKPYILCVGTIEPRKNHLRMLRAFMASDARATHALVVVGKRGWGAEGFFSELGRIGKEADVRILDNVPTEDIPALYGGAAFLVYPSLVEGFGLPILEAMACGCPVLTSDCSSLAEIAGDAALLVDPSSIQAITAGIDQLASNPDLRNSLAARGLQHRREFSWTNSARTMVGIIERDLA